VKCVRPGKQAPPGYRGFECLVLSATSFSNPAGMRNVAASRGYGVPDFAAHTVRFGDTDGPKAREEIAELNRQAANPPGAAAEAASMTPLGRLGQPADVADVVAFLAGSDARWLTGQHLRASGGLGLF
jgi:NAD(P)-dependent dehydrogenase (short-subunit alcohol dehydrogenase family)